ncbi:AbrB family transcriptional regulator [Motiliproteus sediminis]|uniref:AbrB family transcriptional regulator n=1 Tax=Motiliproteus sediminis TaxID=1468178 RepID=UPI001AEF6FC2|nr:AbrB family transcriptional regulator [Motiliproteus sediminis]
MAPLTGVGGVLLTLITGTGGALLAQWVDAPLPWLNGALVAVMLTRFSGLVGAELPGGRKLGLLLISTGIALHFNAAVVAAISADFLLVLLGVCLTLAMAFIGMLVLTRGGYDPATVFFASMPGGASEMVDLAGQHGGREDLVALAHSLRITLIVLAVPAFCFSLLPPGYQPFAAGVDTLVLALVLPPAMLAVWLGQRWRLPSPWMLAPLVVVAAITATFDLHSGMPDWLRNPAQLLIGCALGCRFNRTQLRYAPRFAGLSMLASVLAMAAAAVLAWLLASQLGAPWIPWMLGIMPGGIAELTLTAEMVGQGVAFVTALQVVRLVAVMLVARPGFRLFTIYSHRSKRRSPL